MDYVRNLEKGSHSVCPFDNRAFRDQVFIAYVRGGLERDEAITHASDDVTRDMRLISENFSVENSLDQFKIVPFDETYNLGNFNSQRVLNFWDDEIRRAQKRGYTALRGSADGAMAVERGMLSKLLDYERLVGRVISSKPFMGLCMYDVGAFPGERLITDLKDLLAFHGHAVFPGLAFTPLWSD